MVEVIFKISPKSANFKNINFCETKSYLWILNINKNNSKIKVCPFVCLHATLKTMQILHNSLNNTSDYHFGFRSVGFYYS